MYDDHLSVFYDILPNIRYAIHLRMLICIQLTTCLDTVPVRILFNCGLLKIKINTCTNHKLTKFTMKMYYTSQNNTYLLEIDLILNIHLIILIFTFNVDERIHYVGIQNN